MTGIVILNLFLIGMVIVGIVGLLAWSIVTSMNRQDRRRARSFHASRVHRSAEPTLTASGGEPPSPAATTASAPRAA